MKFLDAAEAVLEASASPLHYKEITRRALEKDLLTTAGQTPDASMGAALYTAVKSAADSGVSGRFVATAPGHFALARPAAKKGLDADIQENNERVERELLGMLREMHPRQVELLVGRLLTTIGFEDVTVTRYVADFGVDVEATLTVGGVTKVKTAIQVKRYAEKNKVDGSTVRELRGGLVTDQRGLVITTSSFTAAAITEASAPGKTPVSLIDGKRLVELLVEKQIGVRRRAVQLCELNLEELVATDETAGEEKSAVLWPLPGGQENYFGTMLAFLDEIGRHQPTVEELAQWVIENFEKVTKEKLVQSYVRAVLYPCGVVEIEGTRLLLTKAGELLRKSRAPSDLHRLLRENILGIVEIEQALASSPLEAGAILRMLVNQLNLQWDTDAQVKHRLHWLAALGVVERRADKTWSLVAAG